MSGVVSAVGWGETAEELYKRYKGEAEIKVRKRLQVLSSSSRGRYRKLLRTLWLVRSWECPIGGQAGGRGGTHGGAMAGLVSRRRTNVGAGTNAGARGGGCRVKAE